MKYLVLLLFPTFSLAVFGQDCNAVQGLSSQQLTDLSPYVTLLDTALKHDDFEAVDSLNTRILEIFGAEAGIPDGSETYYTLTNNTAWLELPEALLLSRELIDADTTFYSELWKLAKGMLPPNDDPHAVFLRASAETAAGLLKIAEKETDVFRQSRYRYWAIRALDSLATMQLPNGAFPFPDLRDYNDPVFSTIIQNFLFSCGADSVNVLQNGWIIDDKGTGEFKFDAGVIAEAYYDAYQYTMNTAYRDRVVSIANYLLPLHLNRNYNYNTFSANALANAYLLTGNALYEQRASENLRYGVTPGQAANGRLVDGHNANSRYHNLIIANSTPYIRVLMVNDPYWPVIKTMYNRAVINLTRSGFHCESSTGFRWLTEAYTSGIVPSPVRDSMKMLIGRHIQQAAINGKYLNVAVLGDYFELLDYVAAEPTLEKETIRVWPNPAFDRIHVALSEEIAITPTDLRLLTVNGASVSSLKWFKEGGFLTADISALPSGIYFLNSSFGDRVINCKIQIIR